MRSERSFDLDFFRNKQATAWRAAIQEVEQLGKTAGQSCDRKDREEEEADPFKPEGPWRAGFGGDLPQMLLRSVFCFRLSHRSLPSRDTPVRFCFRFRLRRCWKNVEVCGHHSLWCTHGCNSVFKSSLIHLPGSHFHTHGFGPPSFRNR
jgi:hypothetical protein